MHAHGRMLYMLVSLRTKETSFELRNPREAKSNLFLVTLKDLLLPARVLLDRCRRGRK